MISVVVIAPCITPGSAGKSIHTVRVLFCEFFYHLFGYAVINTAETFKFHIHDRAYITYPGIADIKIFYGIQPGNRGNILKLYAVYKFQPGKILAVFKRRKVAYPRR